MRAVVLVFGFAILTLSVAGSSVAAGSRIAGGSATTAAWVACGAAPKALTGKPALPAKFPRLARVTYTGSTKVGPTTMVTGSWPNCDLTAAHHAYSKAFKSAGYTITHEEQDAADSEVVFSGYKTTGQVKLAKRGNNRIKITITIRPA